VVSFTAFDPHAAPQYIHQWSSSVQKSLGHDTTLEIGYQGERGYHLQQSYLINHASPAPEPFNRAVLTRPRHSCPER